MTPIFSGLEQLQTYVCLFNDSGDSDDSNNSEDSDELMVYMGLLYGKLA